MDILIVSPYFYFSLFCLFGNSEYLLKGLTYPAKNKTKIGVVFSSTNFFTTTAYLILGLTLGSTFGNSINQSSNLNWNAFHANTGHIIDSGNGSSDIIGATLWTKAVKNYIILFPAIDVVSAYPLNAITLGNNLFGAAYGNRIHEVENNRMIRICFRLLSSIPPIILAILISELGKITDYTGTTGFLIGLTFPALLYLSSRKIANIRNFDLDTYYTNYGSTTWIAQSILWIGIFMVVGVIATLCLG